MYDSLTTPAVLLLLPVTFMAAVTDLRRGLIPNGLTLPLLCLAPLVRGLSSGPGALGWALLGGLLCGAVPSLIFARGGMGGGDVKLYAGIGAALGVEQGLRAQLLSCLLASLWACGVLAHRGQLLSTLWAALLRCVPRAGGPGAPAPGLSVAVRMGPSIFVAALLVVVGG